MPFRELAYDLEERIYKAPIRIGSSSSKLCPNHVSYFSKNVRSTVLSREMFTYEQIAYSLYAVQLKDQNSGCSGRNGKWSKRYVAVAVTRSGEVV